jgi:hypothetical protein
MIRPTTDVRSQAEEDSFPGPAGPPRRHSLFIVYLHHLTVISQSSPPPPRDAALRR